MILAQTLASCVIHGAVPSGSDGSYLITMLMMFHHGARLIAERALTSPPLVSVLCSASLFLVGVPASPADCNNFARRASYLDACKRK